MALRHLSLALAVSVSWTQASASSGTDYSVAAGPDGTFDVTAERSGGDDVYWCGASEYARRELGASSSDRIYAWGRTGNRTARFSLQAPASGPVQSFSVSLDEVGNNLSVAAAYQYCLNVSISG